MGSITEHLLPKLREHFGDRVMTPHGPNNVVAIFSAKHPDFGDIEIEDDGHELTIWLGRFTHSHIANYEDGMTESERAERIVDACISELEDIFADRFVFYGSHETGGGFYRRGERTSRPVGKLYVWSGPVSNDG